MLKLCCAEKNIDPSLPLSKDTLVRFVLWLACDRKVSHATANVYLAGIKQLHTHFGVECPDIRNNTVKMLLQGLRNAEFTTEKINKRNPATADTQKALKQALTEQARPLPEKRLLWAAASLLFFGAFRASEILCRSENEFDPIFCLCDNDISLEKNPDGSRKLNVVIKMPKEEKTQNKVTVEIFETSDKLICPVDAWEKWQRSHRRSNTPQPHFCWENGKPLTITQLNAELKAVYGSGAGISSHSFRIGAATALGELGHSDSEIQAIGRWSSGAFKRYTRKGRAHRSIVAKKFCSSF